MTDSDCKCGHHKSEHVYEYGACRPGYPCLDECHMYRPDSVPAPMVQIPAETVEKLREALAESFAEMDPGTLRRMYGEVGVAALGVVDSATPAADELEALRAQLHGAHEANGRVMRSRDEARARMSGNRLVFTVFAVSVVCVLFGAFAHIMAAVTR